MNSLFFASSGSRLNSIIISISCNSKTDDNANCLFFLGHHQLFKIFFIKKSVCLPERNKMICCSSDLKGYVSYCYHWASIARRC